MYEGQSIPENKIFIPGIFKTAERNTLDILMISTTAGMKIDTAVTPIKLVIAIKMIKSNINSNDISVLGSRMGNNGNDKKNTNNINSNGSTSSSRDSDEGGDDDHNNIRKKHKFMKYPELTGSAKPVGCSL